MTPQKGVEQTNRQEMTAADRHAQKEGMQLSERKAGRNVEANREDEGWVGGRVGERALRCVPGWSVAMQRHVGGLVRLLSLSDASSV